jgi:hypothetical protein
MDAATYRSHDYALSQGRVGVVEGGFEVSSEGIRAIFIFSQSFLSTPFAVLRCRPFSCKVNLTFRRDALPAQHTQRAPRERPALACAVPSPESLHSCRSVRYTLSRNSRRVVYLEY